VKGGGHVESMVMIGRTEKGRCVEVVEREEMYAIALLWQYG
jgi:hypothetical protein